MMSKGSRPSVYSINERGLASDHTEVRAREAERRKDLTMEERGERYHVHSYHEHLMNQLLFLIDVAFRTSKIKQFFKKIILQNERYLSKASSNFSIEIKNMNAPDERDARDGPNGLEDGSGSPEEAVQMIKPNPRKSLNERIREILYNS